MDGAHRSFRRPTDAAFIAPGAPIWHADRLGGGDLRVPRREAEPLGLDPNRRVLCPDALALLLGHDPGSGPLCRRPRLRPRAWRLGTSAVIDHGRCPDRLSVLLLPLHNPDGPPGRQPL